MDAAWIILFARHVEMQAGVDTTTSGDPANAALCNHNINLSVESPNIIQVILRQKSQISPFQELAYCSSTAQLATALCRTQEAIAPRNEPKQIVQNHQSNCTQKSNFDGKKSSHKHWYEPHMTCWQSSRVGTRMNAFGAPAFLGPASANSFWSMGRR